MTQIQEFISTLNWVDYVIVVAFLRGAFVGYRSGFMAELLRIFVYGATGFIAFQFGPMLAPYLENHLSLEPELTRQLGTVLAAFVSFLLLRFLVVVILRVVKAGEGFVYNLAGMAIGIVRWAVVLSALFLVVHQSGIAALIRDIEQESRFAPPILPIARTAFDSLSGLLSGTPGPTAS